SIELLHRLVRARGTPRTDTGNLGGLRAVARLLLLRPRVETRSVSGYAVRWAGRSRLPAWRVLRLSRCFRVNAQTSCERVTPRRGVPQGIARQQKFRWRRPTGLLTRRCGRPDRGRSP